MMSFTASPVAAVRTISEALAGYAGSCKMGSVCQLTSEEHVHAPFQRKYRAQRWQYQLPRAVFNPRVEKA